VLEQRSFNIHQNTDYKKIKSSTKSNYIKIIVRYVSVAIMFLGTLASSVLHYLSLVNVVYELNPDRDPFKTRELIPARELSKTANPAYRT